jgi:hypothetical protein
VNSRWTRRDASAQRRGSPRRFGESGYEITVSNHNVNLTQQEQSLIAESHPDSLERLDEKQLKDLQSRLRTVREKNFNMLRRQGAARVEAEGGRGAAQPANERRNEKVEVIDEALARVNERLEAI